MLKCKCYKPHLKFEKNWQLNTNEHFFEMYINGMLVGLSCLDPLKHQFSCFFFFFNCLLVTINKKIESFLKKSPTLKFVIDGDSTDNPKTFIKKAAGMKEASKSKGDSDGPSCSSSTNYRRRRSPKEVIDENNRL